MSLDLALTRASAAQAPEIARVFRSSRLEALPYLPILHSPEEDLAYFREADFAKDEVWTASLSGSIIGFIAFSPGWINHLYLLPGMQGKGIGSRLLDLALSRREALSLWTFQRNSRAIRFYQSKGFIESKRTDGAENEEKTPDVLLHWNP